MNETFYENIGERLYSETLPNGLKVRVLVKPGFVKSFAMFATNYGGAMRRFELNDQMIDTPEGVAHYLEHKMFDTPEGNAFESLSKNGASPNAFTAEGITAYYFESTAKFLDNLRILLSFVSVPYFTEESVQKEQGIIAQEIRMYDDHPGFRIYDEVMHCLYEHHPVRENVAGTVESIAQITAQTLYDCHKAFYAPSNMVLTVVGDVNPDEVIAAALEVLPNDCAPVPKPDFGEPEGVFPVKTRAELTLDLSAPQFTIASKLVPVPIGAEMLRQKITGALALRCMLGRSSAFYTGLYSEGLIRSDFGCGLEYSVGTTTFIASGESSDPEAVFERLCTELHKIAANGFNTDAVERAKRAYYGAQLRGLEDFSGLCIALAESAFSDYTPFDVFEVLTEITAEDCSAFIRDNITREHLAMSVIK